MPLVVIHQAETGIHVWIVGTEPVTKTRPQEARRSARRRAFHHVMLAVEEVGGVAGIERKFFESFEWGEDRGGPLPSVADHLSRAVRTRCSRIDGDRIPALEIRVDGRRAFR